MKGKIRPRLSVSIEPEATILSVMNRPFVDEDVLAKRAARFTRFSSAPVHSSNRAKKELASRPQDIQRVHNTTEKDYAFEHQLVGTCEMLEKCYLRLTTAPKESDVRPRHVLVKSLERVKELWEEGHDYQRASELLKSIRQDMTVQGIRDQLSIDVYETHAKLALHSKDPYEFNVCLSVLESLYKEVPSEIDLRDELMACRILYYLYTGDLADLTSLLGNVLSERKIRHRLPNVSVDHAVNVSVAWFMGSYRKLLELYKIAPPLSSRVMDLFIDRERLVYFAIIMNAYRPSVPTDFLSSELFLDKYETSSFLSKVEAVFTDSTRAKIDCKASLAKL